MGLLSNTNTLLSVTAATGAQVGKDFNTLSVFGEYIPISVTISAGTATVIIEGRASPADAWAQLDSTTVSAPFMLLRTAQIRARTPDASAATIRVSTGVPVRG